MTEQLPIFVYGNFRPGNHNYPKIRDFVESHRAATMEGFSMYNYREFPGIIGDRNFIFPVTGEILVIKPEKWEECIALMDQVEHNGYHFIRTNSYVAQDHVLPILVNVWVYLVNPEVLDIRKDIKIGSGNWLAR